MNVLQFLRAAGNLVADVLFSKSEPSRQPRPAVTVPGYNELDLTDKNYWAALFSDDIDILEEDLPDITVEKLQTTLEDFRLRVGQHSLSPSYYSERMYDLCQSLIGREQVITDYQQKRDLLLKANQDYKRIKSNTLFMEKCFDGEISHLDIVFQGQRLLLNEDCCLDAIVYYKNIVSPLLYKLGLEKLKEMLEKYEVKTNFGEELYDALQSKLDSELDEIGHILKVAPKKLPISMLKKSQETKPTKTTEITHSKSGFLLPSIQRFLSYATENPAHILVGYLFFSAQVISAVRPIKQTRDLALKRTVDSSITHRSKRFNGMTTLFQVGSGGGTFAVVAPWGTSNFMDFWIDGNNEAAGIFLSSSNSSSLGPISFTNQTVGCTAATGNSNGGAFVGLCQPTGSTYDMSIVNINSQGMVSSPTVLFSNLSNIPGYYFRFASVSQNFFSTGGFAAIGIFNGTSGSEIQLKYVDNDGAVTCTVTANTVTSGNQYIGTVDVLAGDYVFVAWVNQVLIGFEGYIDGQLFGPNCAKIGSYVTIDDSSQYLTLPSVSRTSLGMTLIWSYNDISTATATYSQLFNVTSNGVKALTPKTTLWQSPSGGASPLEVGSTSVLTLPAGGWVYLWETCGSGGGTYALQFSSKTGSLVGSNMQWSSDYCDVIAAAVSQDGNNLLVSWAAPSIVNGGGIGLAFTTTNLYASETYSEGNPTTFNNALFIQLPSSNPGTNVTVSYTFSDPTAGSLTLSESSGLVVTNNPLTITGNINDINQALAGVEYNPAAGYGNNYTITTQIVDNLGLAPTISGSITVTETQATTAPPTTLATSSAPTLTSSGTPTTTSNPPTNSGQTSGPATTAPGAGGSSFPVAAVAGGGVAGLAVLACAVGGGFFAAQSYRKTQAYRERRKEDNTRLLADEVYSELKLRDFENFDDGAQGAQFVSAIALIANDLKAKKDGVSIDITQKIGQEIQSIAGFIAQVIKDKDMLTSSTKITKFYYGVYKTIDLGALRRRHEEIADAVLQKIHDLQPALFNAHSVLDRQV